VDVRAAVFEDDDRVLMVREISDGGRWTLPGGWADVNRTAAQNAVKEALEESGFEVEPLKFAAVWDRTKQGHAPHVFSCRNRSDACSPTAPTRPCRPISTELGDNRFTAKP
jgi:ADP-ribose pyrophosphatase YjhB (NUDIX family)